MGKSQGAGISLSRNFNSRKSVTVEELQFQIGELLAVLEDYLNTKVNVFYVDSKGQTGKLPRPTLKKGDFLLDLKIPGVATLQFWDGEQLISFNLANFAGYIDLITQGIGSGTNPTLFLRSDGADHWVLATIPSPTSSAPTFSFFMS